ncbi:OmpP1/FadL family transporter [Spirosoma koreense]
MAATSPMVLAQGLGNSPYSALGIGELYSQGNVTNLGMGGVGISNASSFYMNLQNPALLARRTRFTVFEVGLIGETKSLSQYISNSLQSQRATAVNLGYLALAFPANSRWNMAISLKPYSYVNYTTQQETAIPGSPYKAEYSYTGRGGLNKASFSNGVRVTKNLYAGIEASFLFGNITYSSNALVNTNSSQDVGVGHLNRINYSDVVWKLGAAWRPKINDTWTLNLGATFDPQTRIKGTQTDIYQKSYLGAVADTLRLNSSGKATLPHQVNFGISVEKNNTLLVGVDVGFQQWSQYRTSDNASGSLRDGINIAAGVEYTPKINSNRYRDLITYRAGFQYNRMPYLVNGTQINDINGSIGLSLPLGSYLVNHVTLSVVGGQRGVLTGTQIREQYVRMALGFSLNDWWFRKQVVD